MELREGKRDTALGGGGGGGRVWWPRVTSPTPVIGNVDPKEWAGKGKTGHIAGRDLALRAEGVLKKVYFCGI